MKIKALLKRGKNNRLYADKKSKETAKRISGFGWEDIYQFCIENDYAGVVRQNGQVSLTTMERYRQELFA